MATFGQAAEVGSVVRRTRKGFKVSINQSIKLLDAFADGVLFR